MMYKKILEVFPTPEFLNVPCTGISISDNSVRCIRFEKKDKGLNLEKYIEKTVPSGVVSSGMINNPGELSQILQSLKEEINIKYARVSLPEEKAYQFTTTIPLVPKKEVRNAIEFKIEENVPLPANEIVFDYVLMNPQSYTDSLEVVVSALPVNIVDMYVEVMKKAEIPVLSLEIKSQAITRAVLSKTNTGTFMIVHFKLGKIGLYVVRNNIVHFTSTIISEGESLEFPEFLSIEIKKLTEYWNSLKENMEKEERHISGIIICGGDFKDSVVPYLSARHKMPVSLCNVWTNIFDLDNSVPPIPFTDSLRYASAVGLAIPTDILI